MDDTVFWTLRYLQITYDRLLHTLSIVKQEVNNLELTRSFLFKELNEIRSMHRSRRSLIPIVGKALSFLFGTLSEDDVSAIKANIRTIRKNQQVLSHVVRESLTIMKTTQAQSLKNTKTINNVIDVVSALNNAVGQLKSEVLHLREHLYIYTELDFALSEAKELVSLAYNNSQNEIKVLIDNNDCAINDNTEKANLLNVFFASQSTIDDDNKELPNINSHVNSTIDNIVITEQDVTDFLLCLDTSKTYGNDSISPKMLKEASHELSVPLCKLYNLSLKNRKFPSQWKIANVVPVFKKNDPKKVENYRPISLLCCMSKIFEKCIYKYLHNYIVTNKLISPHQSGFTKGDSTVNQLLYISEEFVKALDNGKEIRVVFFDISKAFDRVWHKGLVYKLEKFGIVGNLLSWIIDYLTARKQKVIINGKESTVITINSGVPQGSILGPLFFLIFINDIVLEVGCTIKLFADDTSIYVVIDNPNIGALTLNYNLEKNSSVVSELACDLQPPKNREYAYFTENRY